mmetsp:Transcript_43330/g.126185  ORF Transcript_43330/g.126185 Transcript_43330/m.126185 type:complete len:219 (-) Transcript_43330:195-851(-)
MGPEGHVEGPRRRGRLGGLLHHRPQRPRGIPIRSRPRPSAALVPGESRHDKRRFGAGAGAGRPRHRQGLGRPWPNGRRSQAATRSGRWGVRRVCHPLYRLDDHMEKLEGVEQAGIRAVRLLDRVRAPAARHGSRTARRVPAQRPGGEQLLTGVFRLRRVLQDHGRRRPETGVVPGAGFCEVWRMHRPWPWRGLRGSALDGQKRSPRYAVRGRFRSQRH